MAISSVLACSGPVNDETGHAVRESALLVADVDTEASNEIPDGCSPVPEPTLLVADMRVDDGMVVMSVENTTKGSVQGNAELLATTSRGMKSNIVPLALAGLDRTTLTVPLKAAGIDDTINLTVLPSSIRATLDDGTTTFASATAVHDVRSTKP